MKKPKRKPKTPHSRPGKDARSQTTRPNRPAFEIEALEPRILLSGTWVGTEGDDSLNAGNQGDELQGLGGHDILHGGTGGDILDGGTGNDQLFGEQGNDTLISGGGNDVMDGGQGSDVFQFAGAQHGDVITVVGGNGPDTIDLSSYHNNQLHESGSSVTVDLGGGQSFIVNHSGMENLQTADGTYAPGSVPVVPVNHAPTATDGSLHINEDASGVIYLSGTDPDTGDAVDHYVIDSAPDHGTLLLNGNAVNAGDSVSQADVNAGHLTYTADANWSGDTSIGFHAHDGDALSVNAGTFAVHVDAVAAVNEAPTASDGSLTLNEDASAAVHLSGTDPDAGDAVDHYVIDSTPDHGTLQLNGNAVNVGDSVSQADVDAGHLTYSADPNWSGDTSIGFHAHDGDALSVNAGTFAVHVDAVAAVNEAPTASDGSLTLNEDASAAVHLSGTDPDAGDAVDHYVIDSTPDHGTLQLNGNAVNVGDSVSQADVDAGHLTYTADPDWHGDTNVAFHAHDGDALSANAGSFAIHVDPVNDAPTASDGSLTLSNEDAAAPVHLSGADPDAGDAVDHYVIDSTPDHGTLLLNGNAVHAGDSVSQADVDAGHLTFAADPNWYGDTSIGFHAHDGDALSANAGSFAIHVDSVNDAPAASDGSVHINEDASGAIRLSGADPDAGDAVDHYVIDSTPDHGTLLLNGNAVHSGDSVSQADIDAGHLTFTPDADWNGETSFGFHAHDGEALSETAATFSIHVDAVNDAPTASDGSVHNNEDSNGAVYLTGTDLDAGDAVDHYVIDSTPDHGTLLLSGNAVHSGDSVSQADIDAGHLTFTPDADWNGETSFGFHAHDGEALSANAGTFSIHVDAVADAPMVDAGLPAPPPVTPPMDPLEAVVADGAHTTAASPVADVPSGPMPVTPPSRPVHEAPADALPESPPVVDTTPSPDAVDVPPPAPAVPIHAPSHGGVAPVIKPHPTPGAIPVFGEPADTDLDAVAALNTTEASASSGSAAHDAAPVGGVDAAAGGVTWSGGEDMAVLDPKADLGDSFESTRFADAEAAPFDFHEMPVPVSSAFEDHFSVTQVASMPTFALTASTAAAGLVPANPRGSVADEFEPESQRDAQRRWASRFSDAGQGDAAQAWDESHEGNSPPSPEDSGVYVPVASDGFFARLWGAVRGLGGSLSRSHADEREHKRG